MPPTAQRPVVPQRHDAMFNARRRRPRRADLRWVAATVDLVRRFVGRGYVPDGPVTFNARRRRPRRADLRWVAGWWIRRGGS